MAVICPTYGVLFGAIFHLLTGLYITSTPYLTPWFRTDTSAIDAEVNESFSDPIVVLRFLFLAGNELMMGLWYLTVYTQCITAWRDGNDVVKSNMNLFVAVAKFFTLVVYLIHQPTDGFNASDANFYTHVFVICAVPGVVHLLAVDFKQIGMKVKPFGDVYRGVWLNVSLLFVLTAWLYVYPDGFAYVMGCEALMGGDKSYSYRMALDMFTFGYPVVMASIIACAVAVAVSGDLLVLAIYNQNMCRLHFAFFVLSSAMVMIVRFGYQFSNGGDSVFHTSVVMILNMVLFLFLAEFHHMIIQPRYKLMPKEMLEPAGPTIPSFATVQDAVKSPFTSPMKQHKAKSSE